MKIKKRKYISKRIFNFILKHLLFSGNFSILFYLFFQICFNHKFIIGNVFSISFKCLLMCGFFKGVFGGGKFEVVDDLIKTVTAFIFLSSVGHAAANFCQYDEYAFPPNYPALLNGKAPSAKVSLACFNNLFNK